MNEHEHRLVSSWQLNLQLLLAHELSELDRAAGGPRQPQLCNLLAIYRHTNLSAPYNDCRCCALLFVLLL